VFHINGVTHGAPSATLGDTFPGGTTLHNSCAVPVVVGNYWVQTVPEVNGLIALDLSDPEHPVEASRITLAPEFHMPHWVAANRASDRLVVTGNNESWALVVKIDPKTGAMTIDETLPNSRYFDRLNWPHGQSGPAVVHGALFGD
jgi:hypothetical protein